MNTNNTNNANNANNQQNKETPNVIETFKHSLFIETIPDRFEAMEVETENNLKAPKIYERLDSYTSFNLYLGEFAEEENENNKIYNTLITANPETELNIYVNSFGGNFHELVDFYNIIKPRFQHIVTYLHKGYSAGSMAFLLGDERIVYEHSDFMIHSYIGAPAYSKRQDMLDQAKHIDEVITNFFNTIYSPYFTKKELKKVNKNKEYWLNSDQMINRGIATGIILSTGEYQTREEYLDAKSKKSKKDKKGKK